MVRVRVRVTVRVTVTVRVRVRVRVTVRIRVWVRLQVAVEPDVARERVVAGLVLQPAAPALREARDDGARPPGEAQGGGWGCG